MDRNWCILNLYEGGVTVALRKESVDRNVDPESDSLTDDVALRKESVDRNVNDTVRLSAVSRRSPQGERG